MPTKARPRRTGSFVQSSTSTLPIPLVMDGRDVKWKQQGRHLRTAFVRPRLIRQKLAKNYCDMFRCYLKIIFNYELISFKNLSCANQFDYLISYFFNCI